MAAMGAHQSPRPDSYVWLTPPAILAALGPFDFDPAPCPPPRPWPTAQAHHDGIECGTLVDWPGRVWLNPPYGSAEVMDRWLGRMAQHGHGTALIFARTETAAFHKYVWRAADACLFLEGRLHFHHQDGRRAKANAGAPSVLVAYGPGEAVQLRRSGLDGYFVPLRGR